MSSINTTDKKDKKKYFYFDRICSKVHRSLVDHKILAMFLALILTPLVIFPVSLFGLDHGALKFSAVLTILLYLIYFNIALAHKNYKVAIIFVFIISFVLKFYIATQFFGTADMVAIYDIGRFMDKGITTNIYLETNNYTPSPFISWVIYIVNQVSHVILVPLSTLFKIPLMIFDMLVALLLIKIVKKHNKKEKESFRVVASFLYNPIIIFVTAYGSQYGIMAIYFLLLYYYIRGSSKNNLSHLVYGISIAIKQVTIFPVVFFTLRQRGIRKLIFLFLISSPFVIITLPYFIEAWKPIINNVFGHSGIWGFWSYSRAIQYFTTFFGLFELQRIITIILEKTMTIVIFGAMLYYFNKYKKISMLEGILISYLFFYVLTPGFGVQYLIWILPFAVLFNNFFYYVYSILGSFIAFFFYYGHGTGNMFIREVLAFSLVGPILWIFIIYWLWRVHKDVKLRHIKNQ